MSSLPASSCEGQRSSQFSGFSNQRKVWDSRVQSRFELLLFCSVFKELAVIQNQYQLDSGHHYFLQNVSSISLNSWSWQSQQNNVYSKNRTQNNEAVVVSDKMKPFSLWKAFRRVSISKSLIRDPILDVQESDVERSLPIQTPWMGLGLKSLEILILCPQCFGKRDFQRYLQPLIPLPLGGEYIDLLEGVWRLEEVQSQRECMSWIL